MQAPLCAALARISRSEELVFTKRAEVDAEFCAEVSQAAVGDTGRVRRVGYGLQDGASRLSDAARRFRTAVRMLTLS